MTLKAEEEAAKRSEGGQRVEAGPWHLRRHEASSSLPPSFLDHHVVLYQRKRINKQVNGYFIVIRVMKNCSFLFFPLVGGGKAGSMCKTSENSLRLYNKNKTT